MVLIDSRWFHLLMHIICNQRNVEDKRNPTSIDKEQKGEKNMDQHFWKYKLNKMSN